MIVKRGNKWVVKSHTTGRVLGVYDTHKEAAKRLKQIQFFKNLKKSKGGKGSLLAKIKNKKLFKKI
jgi:hypothetical protein